MQEWEREEEELIHDVVDTLPRLKQYRLSEPQKVFLEKLEGMVEQATKRASLAINETIQ